MTFIYLQYHIKLRTIMLQMATIANPEFENDMLCFIQPEYGGAFDYGIAFYNEYSNFMDEKIKIYTNGYTTNQRIYFEQFEILMKKYDDLYFIDLSPSMLRTINGNYSTNERSRVLFCLIRYLIDA